MATEKSRQTVLIAAGLGVIKSQTDISGNPREVVTLLVDALEQYGQIEGEPALVIFLREVATQVGEDKQEQIEGFCEQFLKESRDKNTYDMQHLTVYVDSRPTEPEPIPVSADIGPNPYKGLSAFQETDAERFFGRERVTRALWERFCVLHAATSVPPPLVGRGRGGGLRLLAILGPSGSGKSSVARAGLLPKLAEQPLPGKQRTRVAVFTPGTHPLEALALILARIDTSPQTLATKTSEFTKVLTQGTDGQWEGLRRIADTLPESETQPLILLIDQFEEVYLKDVPAEERRQFLDNLLCAAADPSGRVSVILTLRSDFLGQTQSHPQFNQAIADNEVLIPVMDEAELRDAIAKPAENAGHALDEACVDLLIEQTRDREGALPLLQFALTRIWDGLAEGVSPADTLKQIGGVGGALAGEAQRLYEKLPETDQAIARRAFLALVQLGEGTRDTRRRISLTEIVAYGEEAAHVQAVIRCFADPRARLVTLSATPDGTETAEVTHEALLDHWETLKEWLDDNREDLRFHRHLAADASYWASQDKADGLLWRPPDLDLLRQYHQRAGQDMTPLQVEFFDASERKERHSKWVKRITFIAIILAVVSSGVAGFTLFQNNEIHRLYNEIYRLYNEIHRLYFVSRIKSLVLSALQDNFQEDRERAALLAWQASRLNRLYQGDVHEDIEEALRIIFRTSSIVKEPGSPVLMDQVCQKVKIKVALEPEEWNTFVGTDISYEPACPELQKTAHIRLRSEKMVASDGQALSLNLRNDGHPRRYIENNFERQGEVVIDHSTNLMWQQSGSEPLVNREAAEEYIMQLNRDRFAGYDDWRLPTIPELVSLFEPKEQSNELFINPIFDAHQKWCWSADEPQWNVSFRPKFVSNVYIINGGYSVRAVRSWHTP